MNDRAEGLAVCRALTQSAGVEALLTYLQDQLLVNHDCANYDSSSDELTSISEQACTGSGHIA
ncbi:hypothetical protein [Burkholderia pseudomallei]|uniref:hypothetical protein n=1 Tax=Burkholderia pseudomallei TaxID=28450 RepID=UPI0011AF6747|nr:hypothetical protein [Burkholderia pseudomallei]